MTASPLSQTLAHAVTRYDRRANSGKRANIYALGHYLKAVDLCVARVRMGETLQGALNRGMVDRLRDSVLSYVATMPPAALECPADLGAVKVTLSDDDWPEPTNPREMTLAEFFAANADGLDESERARITAALIVRTRFEGGGGAAAGWILDLNLDA